MAITRRISAPEKQTVKNRPAGCRILKLMAKQQNGNLVHANSRRVTIPAYKDYLILSPGETGYVVGRDGVWPDAISNVISKREEDAYEKGVNDGKAIADGMARNTRPLTPEEFLQKLLPTLHDFHAKDQNQIAAVILDELNKARVKRLNDLRAQLDNTRELIALCEESMTGLQLVREGVFEKLNFR